MKCKYCDSTKNICLEHGVCQDCELSGLTDVGDWKN